MKISDLIKSLKEFQAEGKSEILFGTDEELNNVFDKPFWQEIDVKPELLVFSPDESSRIGSISDL